MLIRANPLGKCVGLLVLDFVRRIPMVDVFRGVVKLMRRDRARAVREIERLDKALAALGYNGAAPRRHTMSAAARKRISDAQKGRWAKVRRMK